MRRVEKWMRRIALLAYESVFSPQIQFFSDVVRLINCYIIIIIIKVTVFI